jgi:hypothetical protein
MGGGYGVSTKSHLNVDTGVEVVVQPGGWWQWQRWVETIEIGKNSFSGMAIID